MDTYHQPQRFLRPPPPPSMADHHHHHHQQPPPPRQPAPWYPPQFQYHPSQSPSPSPSPAPLPPPHQQQQWTTPPPPQSDHLPPHCYPPPPLPPYPPHSVHNQFPPPPRSHFPPPPHPHPSFPHPHHHPSHPHSQVPQSYPQSNQAPCLAKSFPDHEHDINLSINLDESFGVQEWGNPNWAHHQGWDYSAHNNEEDWAARARAWAAAKAAMENQHIQSQFPPVGRQEESNCYHDQYPQTVDAHYPDIQHQSFSSSSYQQFPTPAGPLHRPSVIHVQESTSISSGPCSYVPDGRPPFAAGDGIASGDSSSVFPHQENFSTSSSIHQQEVPYSYSSITGKDEVVGKNEQLQKVLPVPVSSAQEGQLHGQSSLPAVGRSVLSEKSFVYSNQTADHTVDLSDQPLDFAPRFNREHDPNIQSSYAHSDSVGPGRGMDPVAAVPSIHNWTTPVGSGVVYPPVLPAGPQHDPSIPMASAPGHAAPIFGRMPGPSFQQTIPSASAPFGLGAGTPLHPTTAFPGDAYNLSSGPERPKKASVPNWLREEIIKKKAVITSSSQEHPREESQFIEEGVDKSFGKVEQADSKSVDSSRSTEEEDDDEDDVEAARTAAINQEIKRIVTEVLLKVTDELFDEIATKVLSEDDMTVEVDERIVTSNHKVSQISPPVLTPKASAKVLIPVKDKEAKTEVVSGKSSSSSPGDVLGLASYASDDDDDDDEDDKTQNSNGHDSRENSVYPQSSMKKLSDQRPDAVENGSLQVEIEEDARGRGNIEGGPIGTSSIRTKNNGSAVASRISDVGADTEMQNSNIGLRTEAVSIGSEDEINVETGKGGHVSGSKECVGEKALEPELHRQNANAITGDGSQGKETKTESGKSNRHETKKSSEKSSVKEEESSKLLKRDEIHRKRDERNFRKDKIDDQNGSHDRTKRHGGKSGEKVKESESRKRSSHLDAKEDQKETEKLKRTNVKSESTQKRERSNDEKEDRSRHKLSSDSGRHKRRRSSSISSRGRNSKDNSVVSRTNASSDEGSEDSKRKLNSRKRNLSPSPTRSRRRQVSRSPHSKHSQRRHSPYSSLETTRGRRSRSKSPVRRQR